MTRVLSYNILLGGSSRTEFLDKMIRSAQPDIVGLVEATNAQVVEELAARAGMQFRLSGEGKGRRDWQVAVLSRLPILHIELHTRPAIFTRRHLLEVSIEGTDGTPLTIFVIHLTSNIYQGQASVRVRRVEVQELLTIMEARKGTPHLVMGDFNSLAPGDRFSASSIIRYVLGQRASHPKKRNYPLRWRAITTVVRSLVHSRIGSALLDRLGYRYARGGIDLLLQAGYVDCFRHVHPDEPGYTFPSAVPSTRIDFLFASPELAAHLTASDVVTNVTGMSSDEASDHLPVWAEFEELE